MDGIEKIHRRRRLFFFFARQPFSTSTSGFFLPSPIPQPNHHHTTNNNDSPVDDPSDPTFVCERVCASPRLLRRMGGLSRDATPSSCVTVCGPGQEDACAEACQRAVCASLHQVPAWNDACLKRCTTECTRGRAG